MSSFRLWIYASFLIVFNINLCCVCGGFPQGMECDFYDAELCDLKAPDIRCNLGTSCDPAPGRPAYCMVQWRNDSSGVKVTKKGCWGEDERCINKTICYEDRFSPQHYYSCCCEGQWCNVNFTYNPQRPYSETADSEVTVCEFYDSYQCEREAIREICHTKSTICKQRDHSRPGQCYARWTNNSGVYTIARKSCYHDDVGCSRSSCVAEGSLYCCCTGSMCNVDVEQVIDFEEIIEGIQDGKIILDDGGRNYTWIMLVCCLLLILAIAMTMILRYSVWPHCKSSKHDQKGASKPGLLPTTDTCGIPPTTPLHANLIPLNLIEIKARGRFTCLWKAKMHNEIVAVKIFQAHDGQAYKTEKKIYELPYFSSNENVLKFLGGERRGDHLNAELWLISEFHEKGSLYDFLKDNLVSWSEVIRISESMTRGLAFLHKEILSDNPSTYKPSVVHRDFKSKNVLIKQDNTACIADFGLALMFEGEKAIGDQHGQVGTWRYMAPEVLEGAIEFSCDHFLHSDMYACGLVLWEIMTRCSAIDGPVDEYQLPFEDTVGQHPSLKDMQDEVVFKASRPNFKEQWATHQGLTSLYQTITECWDTDPEARLSAGCVQERVSQLYPTSNQLPTVLSTITAGSPVYVPCL